eukprot:GAHX01000517.1.p1 GENE.GAHX01000517.1~~GAHX01000517.1.p1  ORF type:complete len:566 (+),score=134.39 GAHX01000517.1:48-1745(+)
MAYTKSKEPNYTNERTKTSPMMVIARLCPFCTQRNAFKIPVPMVASVSGISEVPPYFKINGLCTKCHSYYPLKFCHPAHHITDESFATIVSVDEFHIAVNTLSLKLKVSFQSKRDDTIKSLKTKRRKVVEIFPLYSEDNHSPVQVRRDTIKALDEINKKKMQSMDPFLVTKDSGQRYAKDLDYLEEFDRGMSKEYTECHRFYDVEKWQNFYLRIPELRVNKDIEYSVLQKRVPYDFSTPVQVETVFCRDIKMDVQEIVGYNEECALLSSPQHFSLVSLKDGTLKTTFKFNGPTAEDVYGGISNNAVSFHLDQRSGNTQKLFIKICNLPLLEKIDSKESFTNFEYSGEKPERVWALEDKVAITDINNEGLVSIKVFKVTEQGNVFERVSLTNLPIQQNTVFITNMNIFYVLKKEDKCFIKGLFYGGNFDFPTEIEITEHDIIRSTDDRSLLVYNTNNTEISVYKFEDNKKTYCIYRGFPNKDLQKWFYDSRNNMILGFTKHYIQVFRIDASNGTTALLHETALNGELDEYLENGELGRLSFTDCKYIVMDMRMKKWVLLGIKTLHI